MRTCNIFSLLLLFVSISFGAIAQTTSVSETIPVSGNCGMCKSTIEKAAKDAGAATAEWDADAKSLKVSYASKTTNAAKIQGAIAAAGYDTRDVRANEEAYNKLHGCCKYERKPADKTKSTSKHECKDDKSCCNEKKE